MARLDQTPQLDREDAPVGALRAVPTLDADSAPLVFRETNVKAQARWYNRPVVALAAAAAAVALIVGGVVGGGLALQGAATSQQADALAAITTASDVQRVESSVSTGGSVTLVWSLHLKKSALISKGLTVLPSNKTYEIWYIDSAGTPTPAGLFDSNGKNMFTVLTGHMAEGDIVGVTVEPSGGSQAPTTKPVVAIPSA
jgi:anti-sigma-K factor RskA